MPGKFGDTEANSVNAPCRKSCKTKTRKKYGQHWKPLEQIIYDASLEALQRVTRDKAFLINGGKDCVRHLRQTVNLRLPDGCLLDGPQGPVLFEEAHLELAYRVNHHQWS